MEIVINGISHNDIASATKKAILGYMLFLSFEKILLQYQQILQLKLGQHKFYLRKILK